MIAKEPVGTTPDARREMLQRLLADRFGLAIHWEEKPMPVYVLKESQGAVTLKAAGGDPPSCVPSITKDNFFDRKCRNVSMEEFAELLPTFAPQYFLGEPVINRTSLTARYDFNLDWTPLRGGPAELASSTPTGEPPAGAGGPTIFDAVEKGMGLKLQSARRPMRIMFIDHVNRVPAKN